MAGINNGAQGDMNVLLETWRDFEEECRTSAASAYTLRVNSAYDAGIRVDVLALQPRPIGQGSLFDSKEESLGRLEMRLGSAGIVRREGQTTYAVHEGQLCGVFSELSRVIRAGEARQLPAAGLPAISITGTTYFHAFECKYGALFRALTTYTTPGTGTDEHTTACREFIEALHRLAAGKLSQQSSIIHVPFGQSAGQV
ncbi:hypothetical protein HY642_03085 [Candidatus Woesearchaeota archaeon]|nr:hypothetical protein [Candidatus Woesearchaeota archaeon]